MSDRYQKSREYLERARKVTPGGAQTLSKMAARFPEGAFPIALMSGSGACVNDIDGNTYVDWICGLGAITLGYDHAHVRRAVEFELECGCAAMSLPHELEVEVAERLCQKIPCAEMVRFVNSGSEATEAAIRTARIATERDVILTVGSGYHSWHSWFQAVKPWHPGVPAPYEWMIKGFTYNDLPSLVEAFHNASMRTILPPTEGVVRGGVAAVIMEPTLFDRPSENYLKNVRTLCAESGALLIFDEVVCGGRWALAGGQEYFGVTPDLATFGKGLSNGFPIGFLCGKAEYMRHAELISGTFGGHPVSLAAMNATLDAYETDGVIETMWRRGKQLQDHVNDRAKHYDVPVVADGYACKPRIRFACANITAFYDREKTFDLNQLAMSLFLQETAANGILLHPGGLNVCAALTDADMDVTFQAIDAGLFAVGKALHTGDWTTLKGQLCQPVVTVRS